MNTEHTESQEAPENRDALVRRIAQLEQTVDRRSVELAAAQQRAAAVEQRITVLLQKDEQVRQAVIDCLAESTGSWPERRRAVHQLEERLRTIYAITPEDIQPPPEEPPSLLKRTQKLWRKAAAKAVAWKRRDKPPPDRPESPP